MKPEKLEQRVLLRMNRNWISHMKKWYPECTGDVMCLLLEAHTALQGNGADSYFSNSTASQNHLNFAPEPRPATEEANPREATPLEVNPPLLGAHGRMGELELHHQEMATQDSFS